MINFFKKFNISLFLITLVLSLSGLAFYNYYVQKNLLLEQMQSDADDIVHSITAAMGRFYDIKLTMNIQKLISDVSLGLEIFEFRFIEPDGTIRNSMFKEEIGQIYNAEQFKQTLEGKIPLGEFFFETRDYVPVMAIFYPIKINEEVIGIIDLAVDISDYKTVVNKHTPEVSLLRRQTDVKNLLKAIEGSIKNSMLIYSKTDLNDFLSGYIKIAKNIIQISLVNEQGKVIVSSNKAIIGTTLPRNAFPPPLLTELGGRPIYRLVIPNMAVIGGKSEKLLLLTDAAPYIKNEKRLLITALSTAGLAIMFALFIARAIYFSAINRSREDKERLEGLVRERTREIELLSKTDALTGLWNRGHLEEMMDMEFKRARRYLHDMAILVVDLDFFKKINDAYGHLGGDEVLRQISSRIMGCLRETDFVGRYGGEEIVVILSETNITLALEIGEKIRSVIASESVAFGDVGIPVTASIGINALRPDHSDYEEIFAEADEALYASKNDGRNRVTVFTRHLEKV